MTDTITLPRETVSQLTRLFTDMQLSRLPSLWQVSTLLNILTAALEQQAEPVHGDIRVLKYRIHELEGEVMGYKRMLDVAEAASQPQQQAEPVAFIAPLMEQQMFDDWCPYKGNPDPRTVWAAAIEAVNGLLLGASPPQQQAEPVYKDSTPHLRVADSAFESWFQAQPFATQAGIKQISCDSYAAGMGDPLVIAAPQQQAKPATTDGWLQDSGLLYRLTDEYIPQNKDEINVTMADGSRSIEARTRRAGELLDRIRANPALKHFQPNACECRRCIKEHDIREPSSNLPLDLTRMILCPTCGNKRCPKASDHRLGCTDSNAAGQPGSAYPAPPQQQAELSLSSEEIRQVVAADCVPEGLRTPEMEDCLQKYRDRVTGTVKIQEWEDAKKASMVPVIPAESITDAMMNLVDRLGSESKQVDLRAWQHLLVYAPQQQAEPVAWGMAQKDGLILDVICPEEHQSYEGEYTIPLYTAPPQRKPLTVREIAAFVGTHQYGPEQLKWFRLGEAAHGIKEGT